MALVNILLGLMILAVAGVMTFYSLEFFRRGFNSTNWPQGQGRVVQSTMRKQEDEDSTEYLADVEYEYEYNDKIYYAKESRSLGSNKRDAKRYFEEYSKGGIISFYFDPQNPSRTVQFPGLQGMHYARIAIIVLFGIIGLSFMFR